MCVLLKSEALRLELLKEAVESQKASLTCYAATVSACEMASAWEVALAVFSDAAEGLPLDTVIINATISSCEKASEWVT